MRRCRERKAYLVTPTWESRLLSTQTVPTNQSENFSVNSSMKSERTVICLNQPSIVFERESLALQIKVGIPGDRRGYYIYLKTFGRVKCKHMSSKVPQCSVIENHIFFNSSGSLEVDQIHLLKNDLSYKLS